MIGTQYLRASGAAAIADMLRAAALSMARFFGAIPLQYGNRVVLRPYRAGYVRKYHDWMDDPWLRGAARRDDVLAQST